MNGEYLLVLVAGAFSGGFVNGLAGFGTALFTLGWWLQVMPPIQAVSVVLVMSVVSGVQGAILVRRAIEWRQLSRFLIPALIGIPIGLRLLHRIDADFLKFIIAGFMILYGGFFTLRRDLPSLRRPTPIIDSGIGLVGGFLGAVSGLSGALPTMWISMRDWTKEQSRAVLQPYNVVVLGISATLMAMDGVYDAASLKVMAIALPVTLIAAQMGLWTFKHLSDYQFRRLLIVMMFVAGIAIPLRVMV